MCIWQSRVPAGTRFLRFRKHHAQDFRELNRAPIEERPGQIHLALPQIRIGEIERLGDAFASHVDGIARPDQRR